MTEALYLSRAKLSTRLGLVLLLLGAGSSAAYTRSKVYALNANSLRTEEHSACLATTRLRQMPLWFANN